MVASQAQSISGRIRRSEGQELDVTDLRVCWAGQLLIGTSAKHEGGTLELEQINAVSLSDVARMERVRDEPANRLVYRVELKEGTERFFDFTDHERSLCAQTEDGRAVMLRLEEIAGLET